jgi:hypothetical protein
LGTATLRGTLDMSVTQLLGNQRMFAPVTLEGAPANVAPFVVTNLLDRTHFNVVPSLELSRTNKLDIRVSAGYDFSKNTHNLGAFVQIGTKL